MFKNVNNMLQAEYMIKEEDQSFLGKKRKQTKEKVKYIYALMRLTYRDLGNAILIIHIRLLLFI